MKYVVLFNGPPRSGKDTYAKELNKLLDNSIHTHFAEILKDSTHRAFNLNDIPYDYFEEKKDIECGELYGAKPRDCYIHMSEDLFKPLCGIDYFVKRMYNDIILKSKKDIILISDCGFDEEVEYLNKCDGIKCFYVILTRTGCDFKNDSRKYINTELICDRDTYRDYENKENNIDVVTKQIYNDVKEFINGNV